jgi:hypothetical protein
VKVHAYLAGGALILRKHFAPDRNVLKAAIIRRQLAGRGDDMAGGIDTTRMDS